jgi:AcrR family transcriptional regulator
MNRTSPPLKSPPKQLRQDAARNRQQLLDAARTVFGSAGLEAGVEEIARLAGVGTGTLYRHFPSKEDLIRALVDNLSDDVEASADAGIAKQDGTGLWRFLQDAGELQARSQGLLCRVWVAKTRAEQVTSIRAKIGRLVDDAHRHGTLPRSIGQTDVLLVLHGLRGVIETNHEDRPNAWKRYLELATIALTCSTD